MIKKDFFVTLVIAAVLISVGVLGRLVPHLPNFAPIGAIALFGGTYLNKKSAIPTVLGAMLLSDYLLGYPFKFGLTTISIYASFAAITLIGMWLKKHKTISNTIFTSVGGSILFFLVTNAAVWAEPTSWYPRGLDGLFQSWYMGLPFFRNTLMGDLFYTGLLFGGFELILRAFKKPAIVASTSKIK